MELGLGIYLQCPSYCPHVGHLLHGVLMTFQGFLELEPSVSFPLFALLQQTLKTSTQLGSLKTILFLRPDGTLREKAATPHGQTQRQGPQEGPGAFVLATLLPGFQSYLSIDNFCGPWPVA